MSLHWPPKYNEIASPQVMANEPHQDLTTSIFRSAVPLFRDNHCNMRIINNCRGELAMVQKPPSSMGWSQGGVVADCMARKIAAKPNPTG